MWEAIRRSEVTRIIRELDRDAWNDLVTAIERFRDTYDQLAQIGKCDSPGGAEYTRVLREWIEAGFPDLAAFIVRRANII